MNALECITFALIAQLKTTQRDLPTEVVDACGIRPRTHIILISSHLEITAEQIYKSIAFYQCSVEYQGIIASLNQYAAKVFIVVYENKMPNLLSVEKIVKILCKKHS